MGHFGPVRIALALLLVTFVGCAAEEEGDVVLPTGGQLSADAVRRVDFGSPLRVADGRYLLVPVSVEVDREEAQTTSARFEDISRRESVDDSELMRMTAASSIVKRRAVLTNLIIHDSQSGTSRPLLDRRALIGHLLYAGSESLPQLPDYLLRHLTAEEVLRLAQRLEQPQWPPTLLLVGLIERDTNGDGLLDGNDAETAHLHDLASGETIRLTPAENDLAHVETFSGDSRVLLTVQLDTNRDGHFGPAPAGRSGDHPRRNDELRYYLVDLSEPAPAVPVTPEDVRARVLQTAGISATQPVETGR